MDDILLASSDVNLLHKKKKFLSSRFNKNVLGKMSLIIKIETHRDRRKRYEDYCMGILRKDSKEIKYTCEKIYACSYSKG
jgi:predicted MarR family transcription regulator